MVESESSLFGVATDKGKGEYSLFSSFFYDYSRRRVPVAARAFMAIALSRSAQTEGRSGATLALNLLREKFDPTRLSAGDLSSGYWRGTALSAIEGVNEELLQRAKLDSEPESLNSMMIFAVVGQDRVHLCGNGDVVALLVREGRAIDIPMAPPQEGDSEPPSEYTPSLFALDEQPPEEPPPTDSSDWLGASEIPNLLIGETAVEPGDILALCNHSIVDGVGKDRIAELLDSGPDIQEACDRISNLAGEGGYSGIFLAHPAIIETDKHTSKQKEGAEEPSRPEPVPASRGPDRLLILLLSLVLCGIFAVGFAIGWKITDAIREPSGDSLDTVIEDREETTSGAEEGTEESDRAGRESTPAGTFPQQGVIEDGGVRLRAGASLEDTVLGLLQEGQEVTVLERISDDENTVWYKIKVRSESSGATVEQEGYVTEEFVKITP